MPVRRVGAMLAAIPLALLPCAASADPAGGGLRTWTSNDGRTLRGAYADADESAVTLRLENGREAEIPYSRLSDDDRLLAKRLRDEAAARRAARGHEGPLPARSELPEDFAVVGGPQVFRTAHFEFRTEEPVSRAFVSEAAKVYEGTLLALNSLPRGPVFAPPEGERFRGRFLSDAAFDEIAGESLASVPGQRVAGLYLAHHRELIVPYSSLGARSLGSRQTLRRSSDTSTLVHEIVHQAMDRWLPVLPTWFAEGIAEYYASLPYQNGRFDFSNAERGLRERLRRHYGVEGGRIEGVRGLAWWLAEPGDASGERFAQVTETRRRIPAEGGGTPLASVAPSAAEPGGARTWQGTLPEYRDALLLAHYFMHRHRPDAAGAPVADALRAVESAMDEADRILLEAADYEARRIAYNESVERFNQALRAFRDEAARYNDLVERHNAEVRRGVPEAERTPVGEAPRSPVPPEVPVVPAHLASLERERVVDLAALVRGRGVAALLDGATAREIDAMLREAYAEMGYELVFRPDR